jgi:multiple sugar transport system ATP-binding protein
MASITFDGVYKRYLDGYEAVSNMNLDIADGEFMIIVGPSGCGKSTALRMIAGLEDISEGNLMIGSQLVNWVPPKDRDVAMVFQNYALYPHMSVRQNMGYALKLAKTPKSEIEKKVNEVAQILALEPLLERRPAHLSGGQRQRVAMGRAIVRNPKAFLLDEPLSNLDAKLRVQLRAELSRLQEQLGTTTVYVTHDQTEAMTLGDRVAVIRDGVIQQVDTPKTLYQRPANLFVAGFIGSPAMNFVPAQVEGSRILMPFGDAELPQSIRTRLAAAPAARELIAGFRPEHVTDANAGSTSPSRLTFSTRATSAESTGSEQLVYFTVHARASASQLAELTDELGDGGNVALEQGATLLVAKVDPNRDVSSGDRLQLAIDLERIQLFDADSGRSLLLGGNIPGVPGPQISEGATPHATGAPAYR